MKIYNLTFIIDPLNEVEFLKWLRVRAASPSFVGCRLLKVAHVPGDADFSAQAASISMQRSFSTIDEAREWGEGPVENLREEYARWAGGEGLTFATILEELSL